VLATLQLLALAERATVAAVAGALQAGATTVGTGSTWITWPSPVGADLEVQAVLERMYGRRLQFAAGCATATGWSPAATSPRVVDAAVFVREAARALGWREPISLQPTQQERNDL
jgi:fluoroacetyl-CoA thioesterase